MPLSKKSWLFLAKKSNNQFSQSSVIPIYYHSGNFAMREKGGNHLVPGPDYMVDALKLPNQAPRGYGELLEEYVFWRCPDGTQHLFCRPMLAISS
ncbi:hypothetical protein TNCV_898981 [Trichonephila clavipes]|nr:hypothetical protein TNCV_898981 [Trichonephila clavipes]